MMGNLVLGEVLTHLFSISMEKINADLKIKSDIGLVASEYFKKYSEPDKNKYIQPIEIKNILSIMKQIASTKGDGSQTVRLNLLLDLCKQCRNDQELMYLMRIFKVFLRKIYFVL